MKKPGAIVAVIVVIVVLALGGWYLVTKNKNSTNNAYGSSSSSSSNMHNMMNPPSPSSSGGTSSGQSEQQTNAVAIQNYAFSPEEITVKAGTTVTWTNKDSVAHTVTETDGQTGPNSGDVNPNGTYTFTFSKAGTYHYHCSIHPEMVGTVTVTS